MKFVVRITEWWSILSESGVYGLWRVQTNGSKGYKTDGFRPIPPIDETFSQIFMDILELCLTSVQVSSTVTNQTDDQFGHLVPISGGMQCD